MDIAYFTGGTMFFVLCWGLVKLCEKVRSS
jgi:hypothetical protein